MAKTKNDPLSTLATLVTGEGGDGGDDDVPTEHVQKMLDLAEQLTGGNIFDMQVLVSACAEELRIQIREEVEESD